jgi:conjugal transfer pilus assembly protein TraV
MRSACHSLRVAGMALVLAGCVNMSGLDGGAQYACAAPEGVACDSVSGTYANALHHNLPSQRAAAAPTGPRAAPGPGAAPARPASPGNAPAVEAASATAMAGTALRAPPRVLRLWTKPWEDADGDLWDQGYVYVQVDGGRWQLDHVQQRIRDHYAPLQPPPRAAAGASPSPGAPDAPTEALPDLSRSTPTSPFGAFPSLPALPRPAIPPGLRQP